MKEFDKDKLNKDKTVNAPLDRQNTERPMGGAGGINQKNPADRSGSTLGNKDKGKDQGTGSHR